MISKDASPAIFSKRIIEDNSQIHIGAQGEYAAVSRKNYFADTKYAGRSEYDYDSN